MGGDQQDPGILAGRILFALYLALVLSTVSITAWGQTTEPGQLGDDPGEDGGAAGVESAADLVGPKGQSGRAESWKLGVQMPSPVPPLSQVAPKPKTSSTNSRKPGKCGSTGSA